MIQDILTVARYSILAYARHGAFWHCSFLLLYFFGFSGGMTYLETKDGTPPAIEDLYIFLILPPLIGVIIGSNMYGWWRRGFAMMVYVPNSSVFRVSVSLALPFAFVVLALFAVVLGFVCCSRQAFFTIWTAKELVLLAVMLYGSVVSALCMYVYTSLRKASPLSDSMMKSMFGSAWNRESTMMFYLLFAIVAGAGIPALGYHTIAQEYAGAWMLGSCAWLFGISCLLVVQVRTSAKYLASHRFALYKLLSRKV